MECKEVKVLAGGDPRNHEYQVAIAANICDVHTIRRRSTPTRFERLVLDRLVRRVARLTCSRN